jgi:hypothetical protein
MLQSKYTTSTSQDSTSGKRLLSGGAMGVGSKQYAHGGYTVDNRGFANSELEDEEVYRTPQGGMFQVNGASHAQGGEAMNLPQGTEILGKNPIPYTDKTFKEYGQKLMRDYNKFTKILDNKPTGIAKKSAEKMLSKVHSGFTNLMAMQESLKPQGEQTQQYAQGGIQKYWGGSKGTTHPLSTGSMWDKPDYSQTMQLDPSSRWAMKQQGPNLGPNSPFTGTSTSRQVDTTKEPGSSNGEAVMGQIMDYAPIAYNLAQGIFNKPQNLNPADYYNPNENQATNLMANRRYNVNPELEANRNAQINYTRGLRQGAPSQAQYLGNLQNSQISRSKSDAEAYARKQNMDNSYMGEEAQMKANLGQQRAQTKLGVQDMNDRNKAAARSYIPTALSQLQQANQMNRVMKGLKSSDAQKQKLLQGMFRGYGFNKYFNTEG